MRFSYQLKHQDLQLNLTPLIDVVFLLIIFFLVTSSFVHITGVRVQLPEIVTSEGLEKTHLLIEIDKQGKYHFKNKPLSFAALKKHFSKISQKTRLTISADKATAFDGVMKVWDLAREKGLKEVVVLTAEAQK